MSRIKSISKNLPIIVLSIIIIFAAITSIRYVYASGGSFNKADTAWDNENNKLAGSLDDTYPYNSITATISSLSLDVLYGTTRPLVFYHGELPYDAIYDEEDDYVEGWEGYFAEDGTSAKENNPSYGASSTPSATDYWGTGITADSFKNQPTAEEVNSGNIVSLRLLSLSSTKSGFLMWLGSAGYSILNGLAWLATLIIGLIVRAKNLSMEMIMEVLHLDDLNNVLTKNFIYDGDTFTLSAFTAFCILALIASIVAFVIRWVKGSDKTKGIWEIIGTSALGILIIGMCLTGRISSLGSSVSNMANQLMYITSQALSSSGDGDAFLIEVDDASNETEIAQTCELALVNKAYIDLQLCSQFNVSKISDLKFSEFGDTNGTKATKILSGVSSADMIEDFNNNLGYYYWFANSSAVEKTSKNASFPTTDTASVTNKLSSIMTYLQVQYNANSTNETRSALITKIVRSFANPAGGPKFLALLVFAVALVIMALVLIKYALNVVIAKIELFVSLLGMAVAGPLILTANKKLVETGKMILLNTLWTCSSINT